MSFSPDCVVTSDERRRPSTDRGGRGRPRSIPVDRPSDAARLVRSPLTLNPCTFSLSLSLFDVHSVIFFRRCWRQFVGCHYFPFMAARACVADSESPTWTNCGDVTCWRIDCDSRGTSWGCKIDLKYSVYHTDVDYCDRTPCPVCSHMSTVMK